MLGLAFLGGLILNLMPCVFPMLAMKAASLAGGAARGEVRAHAAFYSAGVVLAFAALGGVLLALRAAGAAAGWGFQFQSPVFVAAMAWLLFVVGLNLSGVFEIGGRLAGAGHGLAARGGHVGSFFTGLLAVLVATPCTAPFMGAAIAAALAAPADRWRCWCSWRWGSGSPRPTLLLAAMPGSRAPLPAPGRWMVVLKQALAFPMYAAAAWLVWVISQEAGPAGVLADPRRAWCCSASPPGPSARRTGAVAPARASAGPPRWPPASAPPSCCPASRPRRPSGAAEARAEDGVEPFSAARLAALRAEGRPVFVNMTAAWCVTCLVNERVALRTDRSARPSRRTTSPISKATGPARTRRSPPSCAPTAATACRSTSTSRLGTHRRSCCRRS